MKKSMMLLTVLTLIGLLFYFNTTRSPFPEYEKRFNVHLPKNYTTEQIVHIEKTPFQIIAVYSYDEDVSFPSLFSTLDAEGVTDANFHIDAVLKQIPTFFTIEAEIGDVYEHLQHDRYEHLIALYKKEERRLYVLVST